MAVCVEEGCSAKSYSRRRCQMHYSRFIRGTDPQKKPQIRGDDMARFWSYVDSSGGPEACWPWHKLTPYGYGPVYFKGKSTLAHRMAYELFVAPIPDGLTVDHLCHDPDKCDLDTKCPHRRCCNPRHLEAVTQAVNNHRGNTWSGRNFRKTRCKYGHPFTPGNLYTYPGGRERACRKCRAEGRTS